MSQSMSKFQLICDIVVDLKCHLVCCTMQLHKVWAAASHHVSSRTVSVHAKLAVWCIHSAVCESTSPLFKE